MSRDRWATFTCTLPEADPANPHPLGWPVVLRLAAIVGRAGIEAAEPDNWRDVGFSVDCSIDGGLVFFHVSYIGHSEAQWVLCCTKDRRFIDRFRRQNTEQSILQLAQAIDRALKQGGVFHNVRWYPTGWHGKSDDIWIDSPT